MPSLINYYLSHSRNPKGGEPVPNATLINDSKNVKFNIQPGKTYLVRIVSIAAFATHIVHFDQHPMKIVEVDGVYTDPQVADTISVTAAQRYSVLIQAHNNTLRNFAITSTMDPSMFDEAPEGVDTTTYGTLVYDGKKPMPLPSAVEPTYNVTDDFGLVPKDHYTLLGPVDHRVTLNANFVTMNGSNRLVLSTAH